MNRFIAIYPSRCVACGTCRAACSEGHKRAGLQKEPRLALYESRDVVASLTCHHCEGAPCVKVCPVNAIKHEDDGCVRVDEPTKMAPRLFDTGWEAYRSVGSQEPITVVSAYRSPGTNASLRARGGEHTGVATKSQHMLGKATDIRMPGISLDRQRLAALSMQAGGVGYYPKDGFVHVDTGRVRHW